MTKKEAKIILNAAKYLRRAAGELERLEAPVTRNAAMDELDGRNPDEIRGRCRMLGKFSPFMVSRFNLSFLTLPL